jgi:putative transposase
MAETLPAMATMARPPRIVPAGFVYHVGNRGSRKGPLFDGADDYNAFERLVADVRDAFAVRIIAYCLMYNHWHFLLWPLENGVLSRFVKRLAESHASSWRRQTNTVGEGAVYQSRFWNAPIFDHLHLLAAWRYVERNPVEAGLVERAEDWPWSSASNRRSDSPLTMDVGPFPRPANWLEIVNASYVDLLIDYQEC